jgi:hypothetical protein
MKNYSPSMLREKLDHSKKKNNQFEGVSQRHPLIYCGSPLVSRSNNRPRHRDNEIKEITETSMDSISSAEQRYYDHLYRLKYGTIDPSVTKS